MLMVMAMRCPTCGAAGTLVLGYGPEASPSDSDAPIGTGPSVAQRWVEVDHSDPSDLGGELRQGSLTVAVPAA